MEKIVIEHLDKFYGRKQVLFDINLTIGQGMFGLLGRNGAGKSTLMKTLATLLPKVHGNVTVCGIPIEKAGKIRPLIGYLPQDFSMYPSMTVKDSMDYLGVLSGLPMDVRKKNTEILLKKVHLWEQQRKRVRALSGGMKRRLGIALSLLHEPKVLIVDEPTAGLDPEERIRFRNLLCEVASERIVILSTHIVEDIEATCENIGILNDGHLLYNGTVEHLLESAQGKVYTLEADSRELAMLGQEYCITAMHKAGRKMHLRILSDVKISEGQSCEPNIEDAYMLYLKESGVSVALGGSGEYLTGGGSHAVY